MYQALNSFCFAGEDGDVQDSNSSAQVTVSHESVLNSRNGKDIKKSGVNFVDDFGKIHSLLDEQGYSNLSESEIEALQDIMVRFQVAFSLLPHISRDLVIGDLEKEIDEKLKTLSPEDFDTFSQLVVDDLSGKIPLENLSPAARKVIKNFALETVQTLTVIAPGLVKSLIKPIKMDGYNKRFDDLESETSFQGASILIGARVSENNFLLLQIGKADFATSNAVDSDGETELEVKLFYRTYTELATETAHTTGGQLSFIHFKPENNSTVSLSVFALHNRPAFSTVSNYLGTVLNMSNQDYETHKDLSEINSIIARIMYQSKRLTAYFTAGIFDNDFALSTGANIKLNDVDTIYIGYSFSNRGEVIRNSGQESAHSAHLYYGHKFQRFNFPVETIIGVDATTAALRPAEFSTPPKSIRVIANLHFENPQLPLKQVNSYHRTDKKKESRFESSYNVGPYLEWTEDHKGREDVNLGFGFSGSIKFKPKPHYQK